MLAASCFSVFAKPTVSVSRSLRFRTLSSLVIVETTSESPMNTTAATISHVIATASPREDFIGRFSFFFLRSRFFSASILRSKKSAAGYRRYANANPAASGLNMTPSQCRPCAIRITRSPK